MFLAPTGNPSSLRVGHPDVATEHTDLSPASLPLPVVRGRVRGCAAGVRTAGYLAWEECARRGGILGLGTADSSLRLNIGLRALR